jgi:hypothetical protein
MGQGPEPVKGLAPDGASDEKVWAFLGRRRRDRYSDERAELLARHETCQKIEMSYLGG